MINILNFLFKDKSPEDRPNVEIKLKSTITFDEQITFEQWAAEHNVGIAFKNREGIHNANSMMKLWDDKKMVAYYKDLKLV